MGDCYIFAKNNLGNCYVFGKNNSGDCYVFNVKYAKLTVIHLFTKKIALEPAKNKKT